MQEVNNPLRPLVIRGGYRPVKLDQITDISSRTCPSGDLNSGTLREKSQLKCMQIIYLLNLDRLLYLRRSEWLNHSYNLN